MDRYYQLKKLARLNELTLDEAASLARNLIQATIELSPESAGVGGPIDIAVITRTGFVGYNGKPHRNLCRSRIRECLIPLSIPKIWTIWNAPDVISLTLGSSMQAIQIFNWCTPSWAGRAGLRLPQMLGKRNLKQLQNYER